MTVEPYESGKNINSPISASFSWTMVTRKARYAKRIINYDKIKQLLLLSTKTNEPNLKKFYKIKFSRLDIYSNLNVIVVDADIKKQVGKPEKITKLSKDTLLVIMKSYT